MPCHLVVGIVMHAFDDINFASLVMGLSVRAITAAYEFTHVGPLTTAKCPPCRPDAWLDAQHQAGEE